VVLMDIYLGDFDGRTLCKQIKLNQTYYALPVLLYSAGNIDAESITNSSADGFLQKPFDMKTMIKLVRDLSIVKPA